MSEFNEFKPRLKSPKNRFQLNAGLNLKKLNAIFVVPTIFEPRLKFFKFGLSLLKPQLNTDPELKYFIKFTNLSKPEKTLFISH